MIIAILEDNKGFRASLALPEKLDIIRWPKARNICVFLRDIYMRPQPEMLCYEFRFQAWLEPNKVAFYKEILWS